MGSEKSRAAADSERHERMSVVDTAWLRMDSPVNAMTIVSVLTTAGPVRMAELRRVIATRLLCHPRFRQRPVADALGASWQDDATFDLEAHLVEETLPEPGGRNELQALAGRLASEPLDPARPLWQIHFVARFGAGSAWVLRVHHCYADGLAMLRLLQSLTEPETRQDTPGKARGRKHRAVDPPDDDRPPLANWLDQVSRPAGDILGYLLTEGARVLGTSVQRLLQADEASRIAAQASGVASEFARVLALPDDPPTPLRGECSGRKRVAWSQPLALAEVRAVQQALGCTVNDVLMATVAGALGAYLHDVHAQDTDGLTLRASAPVNLRTPGDPVALGNKFGLVFVDLPVGLRNPLQRVFRVHDTMRGLKGSLQPAMTLMTLGTMGVLPAAVQAPVVELFSRKATLVASNVPGPQAPLHLCGQRIDEMYFWVPQSGSIGVGTSVLSYAGKVYFGVIADERLVAEPQALADRFSDEFATTLRAVTVGLLGPGQDQQPETRSRSPAPAAPGGASRRSRSPRRPARKRPAPRQPKAE